VHRGPLGPRRPGHRREGRNGGAGQPALRQAVGSRAAPGRPGNAGGAPSGAAVAQAPRRRGAGGKSTLIARTSRARPKIADYPFTTLVPNLGVVSVGVDASFVLADVPGLVPGASEGAGLGTQFLKHLSRTRVLVFLLAPDPAPGRTPESDFETLEREVAAFDPEMATRPRLVAWNKIDLPDAQEKVEDLRRMLESRGMPLFPISAVTGEGVDALVRAIYKGTRTRSATG